MLLQMQRRLSESRIARAACTAARAIPEEYSLLIDEEISWVLAVTRAI